MKIKKTLLLLIFYNTLYLFLIFFDIKYFGIWSQITDSISSDSSFLASFNSINSHSIRIALIFPIIYLSSIIDVNYNYIFSLICLFNLNFVIFSIIKVSKDLNNYNYNKGLFLINSIFIIALFMNGRLTFSFVGISLLMLALTVIEKIDKKTIIYLIMIFIGFIFSSVSSGTQLIYLLIISIYFFTNIAMKFPKIKNIHFLITIVGLITFYYLKDIIYASISVNLIYYNNSVIDMLNHGFGKYFELSQLFLIFFPLIIIISRLLYYFKNKIISSKKNILYLSVIFSCFFGGIFGISAFVFGLPVFLIIIYDFISNFNLRFKY